MFKFFAASQPVGAVMCPTDPNNPNCAVCLFPEFSTLISAAFALLYLLVLWAVLGRIANAAINRMLARRIRFLQVRVAVLLYFSMLPLVWQCCVVFADGQFAMCLLLVLWAVLGRIVIAHVAISSRMLPRHLRGLVVEYSKFRCYLFSAGLAQLSGVFYAYQRSVCAAVSAVAVGGAGVHRECGNQQDAGTANTLPAGVCAMVL
jgi:hypothetical protein